MSDLRQALIGTLDDTYGDPVEISVQWDEEADPAEEAEAVVVINGEGGDIVLDQEGAEQFAKLFVSACWEAARIRPGGAS